MSMTVTNIDNSSIERADGKFRDDVLTVAGAGTTVAGTILARDSVSGKLVVYEKGGSTNENGIPKAVLTYDVVAAGAGDEQIRALLSGEVNATRLIISADGDASNIDAPVLDQLRSYGIVGIDVEQLAALDNQ